MKCSSLLGGRDAQQATKALFVVLTDAACDEQSLLPFITQEVLRVNEWCVGHVAAPCTARRVWPVKGLPALGAQLGSKFVHMSFKGWIGTACTGCYPAAKKCVVLKASAIAVAALTNGQGSNV
jgi:hypothetical protein